MARPRNTLGESRGRKAVLLEVALLIVRLLSNDVAIELVLTGR